MPEEREKWFMERDSGRERREGFPSPLWWAVEPRPTFSPGG